MLLQGSNSDSDIIFIATETKTEAILHEALVLLKKPKWPFPSHKGVIWERQVKVKRSQSRKHSELTEEKFSYKQSSPNLFCLTFPQQP